MTTCQLCGAPTLRPRSIRCQECAHVNAPRGGSSIVHPSRRYADDPAAQLFVAAFPDGATLAEVGEALGVNRERVRQIVEGACRSLLKRLPLAGVRAADVLEHLATKHGDPNAMPTPSAAHDVAPRQLAPRTDGTERLPDEGGISEHAARVGAALDELDAAVAKIRARLERADQEAERAA